MRHRLGVVVFLVNVHAHVEQLLEIPRGWIKTIIIQAVEQIGKELTQVAASYVQLLQFLHDGAYYVVVLVNNVTKAGTKKINCGIRHFLRPL